MPLPLMMCFLQQPNLFSSASLLDSWDVLKATSVKRSAVKMSGSEARIKVNHYTVNGHVVWGATAMILSELVFILKEIGMDENGNFK
jgi:hypothetical protein